MSHDERGFKVDTRNYADFTLVELQAAFRELVQKNSKLSLKVRALEVENNQIKMWAGGNGLTNGAIVKLRQEVLNKYFSALPALKKKRGRPTSFKDKVLISQLFDEYHSRAYKSVSLKSWLREWIKNGYDEFTKINQTDKYKQTEILVQKYATAMSRFKSEQKKYKK